MTLSCVTELLTRHFGRGFYLGGRLDVKFINVLWPNEPFTTRGIITGRRSRATRRAPRSRSSARRPTEPDRRGQRQRPRGLLTPVNGAPRFAGRAAVVTGAGAGLGALYVAALAREGAAVVAVDRDTAGAERTAEATRAAGGECRAVTADLAREDHVARMAQAALAWQGHIDILVNNAGGGSSETVERHDTRGGGRRLLGRPRGRERQDGLPVHAGRRRADEAGALRPDRERVVARRPRQGCRRAAVAAYTAAKAGVMGLTRFAARELGPFGVTVNCLVPSLTLSGPVLEAYWARWGEAAQERYLQQVALRRLPRPEEIVSALLFLASDEASYVTGVCLDVNGGSFMA